MRTAVIAFLSAGCIVGSAFAQAPAVPTAAGPAPAAAAAGLTSQATTAVSKRKARRNGHLVRVNDKKTAGKTPAQDALSSCIAMWDRDTHMTRQEWSRACRRVAERLRSETVR